MQDNTPLNQVMEFDHVIRVNEDGTITDEPNVYAPNLIDDQLDSSDWYLLNGYSGQDSYSGPVMHNSEYIGGRMEQDIRSEPGVYVALVSYYTTDADDNPMGDDDGPYIEGWAVARLKD